MQNRLRKLRKEKYLTIDQLSDALKSKGYSLSASSLTKYEREERNPKLETWMKLAEFFNVSVEYLQGLAPKPSLQFFIPMKIPTVTHQEKQVHIVHGKPVFYEPTELKQARADLTDHLAQFRPKQPIKGPLELVVKFCFPLVTGTHDGQPKTTKPDCDNLVKLLQDVMNKLNYFEDDRLVVSLIAQKFWAKIPGLFISLEKVES